MEWRFRGYDAVGKKGWVYGDLTHTKKILKEVPYLEDRVMVNGYEVFPESVGVFTGLYDVNGKDVYEGDIVRFRSIDDNDETLVVSFAHGAFSTANKALWRMEVIGNVFEYKKEEDDK